MNDAIQKPATPPNTDQELAEKIILGRDKRVYYSHNESVSALAGIITTHLSTERAKYREALVAANEGLIEWQRDYERELQEAENSAKKFEAEGDYYGWNFFRGKASGLINHDIGLYKLKKALQLIKPLIEGMSEIKCELCGTVLRQEEHFGVMWTQVCPCKVESVNRTVQDALRDTKNPPTKPTSARELAREIDGFVSEWHSNTPDSIAEIESLILAHTAEVTKEHLDKQRMSMTEIARLDFELDKSNRQLQYARELLGEAANVVSLLVAGEGLSRETQHRRNLDRDNLLTHITEWQEKNK